MTDEQINIAVAECCGWTDVRKLGSRCFGIHPGQTNRGDNYRLIPNYCNNLNAMHEAEKVLGSHGRDDSDQSVPDRVIEYAERLNYEINATARQRAEAFLRTLGKWEESSDSNGSSN